MIGIIGVTGKLGSYVADLVNQQGISSIHLARSPERAKVYASAEIRKMVYANTPEVVEALKGIDVLLMVSARENPERVEEHKIFLDAAKLAGVQHIVYTSFYGADEKATFTSLLILLLKMEKFVVRLAGALCQLLPVRTHLRLPQKFF